METWTEPILFSDEDRNCNSQSPTPKAIRFAILPGTCEATSTFRLISGPVCVTESRLVLRLTINTAEEMKTDWFSAIMANWCRMRWLDQSSEGLRLGNDIFAFLRRSNGRNKKQMFGFCFENRLSANSETAEIYVEAKSSVLNSGCRWRAMVNCSGAFDGRVHPWSPLDR